MWRMGPVGRNARVLAVLVTIGCGFAQAGTPTSLGAQASSAEELFHASDRCIACHKGVTDAFGTDVSIGFDWRGSMMANSARDPYFLAALSREIADHPEAAGEIEGECATCHAPMARRVAEVERGAAELPVGSLGLLLPPSERDPLVADGVSCTLCHQILPDDLGDESTFSGRFHIGIEGADAGRKIFGPFEPDEGGVGIMHSATGFVPGEGGHVGESGLCASCHTLTTRQMLPDGTRGDGFLEQAPFLEWAASSYAQDDKSCQSCHMPEAAGQVPVTMVLGVPRPNVSRHVFRGGNFFVLRMLGRYREELGVTALPQELALAAKRTEEHLMRSTAAVELESVRVFEGRLEAEVVLENLAGHKFPTAYPSRRAWLRFTVEGPGGGELFSSGALRADGGVAGVDSDLDGFEIEPHYTRIVSTDQVQVYEAVMADRDGQPTTALLAADHWAKDNRLLPRGFSEVRADDRIATVGGAASDQDFAAGGDRVFYEVPIGASEGPLTVRVDLLFQPIAFRWADNLSDYDTPQVRRFLRYYREMAPASAVVVASASATVAELPGATGVRGPTPP